MITPEELIKKLVAEQGPCMRLCSYCPDNPDMVEVKECIESMLKEIYDLRSHNEQLMRDIVYVIRQYRKDTGKDIVMEE